MMLYGQSTYIKTTLDSYANQNNIKKKRRKIRRREGFEVLYLVFFLLQI